jgi:hypothetical protein
VYRSQSNSLFDINFFTKVALAVSRRAVIWLALRLDCRNCARVIEELSNQITTAVALTEGQLLFYTPSQLLISRAESLLRKEEDTIQWIDGFETGAVFWDVGANVGVYSLYAARRSEHRRSHSNHGGQLFCTHAQY